MLRQFWTSIPGALSLTKCLKMTVSCSLSAPFRSCTIISQPNYPALKVEYLPRSLLLPSDHHLAIARPMLIVAMTHRRFPPLWGQRV